jgi:hypothetical protein
MDTNKPAPHSHGVAAEPDVVPTRVVVGSAIVLIVLCIATGIFVAALFRSLEGRAGKKDERAIAAAGLERRPDRVPPPPRLQVYAVRHWKDFQAAERERLSTYGWMDRSTGVVHVPIERAMDLIAVRGLGPLPAAPVAMPESPESRVESRESKPATEVAK